MGWRSDFAVSLAAAALALAGAGFALTSALYAELRRMAESRHRTLESQDRLWRVISSHLDSHDASLNSLIMWAREVNRRLKSGEGNLPKCGFTLPDDLSFKQSDTSEN